MIFEIKQLSAEMANEYIEFFENRGLVVGDRNQGCYCVWHHWTEHDEKDRSKLPQIERQFVKRKYALKLITEGKLNGFVAYLNGKMIGFCNVDNKENYYRLNRVNNPESWICLNDNDKVLSLVCYVVDVNLRGKGVATSLLKGIIQYAIKNKFNYIEAYPSYGEFKDDNCCGPISMYEKQGFSLVHNVGSEAIVRMRVII